MNKLERLVPAGIDYRQELRWLRTGLWIAFVYSLGFFIKLLNEYGNLFEITVGNKRVLKGNAVMPDFVEVLGGSLVVFLILAVSTLALMAYHYRYHYQDSKSIYLMKRLPDRWELWRRCLTLPVIFAAFVVLAGAVLLIAYYGVYMLVTPKASLAPGQWQEIISAYLGV